LSGDVTGYRLYITDKNGTQIKDVNTNQYVYDIIGETNHSVYVKAYITSSYGEFMSSNSNSIISKFSPRNNVTSINYDFTTTEDNVNLTIYFNDASDVENGFKLKYKIDNFDEQIVDIPTISSDLHGTTYSYNINVTDVIDSITFSVATYNDIGITEYSNSVLLKTSPVSSLQYAYKYISGNTLIAWEDSIGNNIYKLAYSVNNGDYILLDINTSSQMSSRYKYSASIATSSESIVNFVIYQVINGKLQIPTKLKEFDCSAYSSPKVPSDFRVNWYSDGVARYSWTKNNIDIIGYKIYCSVNNGIETVTTIDCIDNQTEYYYDSPQLINNQDVVRAKIQTLTLVDESVISESIDATYIIVPIVPISNFKKAINDTVITYSWDSLEYVQSYEVHKVINGIDEEYFTLSTDYSFSINYNTMFSIDVYVIVNYYGGKSSVASDTISFCPTTFNSNISTQIKNSNISYNNGFVSTTVKYVRTIQSNQIATLTKTSNVSFIIPSILTATVTYSLKYDGIILDKNYTRMSLNNLNELWLKNTNKELYFVNSATATFNVINSMNLTTSFCDKSTIAKVSTIAVIKNKNVATASQDSMLITNSNLTLISYNVNTVVYITVSTDIAPIFYWFTNKYRLETFINVEIHKTRVACLGDSITAGHPNYWAESGTGNIQSQYEYWLQKRLGDSFEVINKGYGSDTTERCLNRFDRDILSLDAQYVIIQAGTNDLYWAMAENKDNREYLEWKMNVAKDNIITMIKKSLDNGIVPIIGTLIPRTTAQGIYRQALWDFNTWVINYCNSKDDVFYVDFYNAGKDNIPPTPLDEPSIAGNLNPLYDGDSQFDEFGNLTRRGYGVHPSPLGYKIMSEAIPLTLFKALQANAKVYLDAECTVEEGTIESDAYKQVYKLMLHNVDRGRIKTTTRYIKNIGNRPIIYSIYPIKESGVDIAFSINNNEFKDYISGKLDPQGVHKINIQIDVPRFGDIPNAEFNLAMRSFSSVG
jgi:lysophospholipase L1-like esterase